MAWGFGRSSGYVLSLLAFFGSCGFVGVYGFVGGRVEALPGPQGPVTEAVISVVADGVAPFDGSTFDPDTEADFGTDGDELNSVVRNFDVVTYQVEVSLNDADDSNLVSTVVEW